MRGSAKAIVMRRQWLRSTIAVWSDERGEKWSLVITTRPDHRWVSIARVILTFGLLVGAVLARPFPHRAVTSQDTAHPMAKRVSGPYGWREGKLKPGDPAPDFALKKLGSQERIRLSSFKGKKPVALVFGSYT